MQPDPPRKLRVGDWVTYCGHAPNGPLGKYLIVPRKVKEIHQNGSIKLYGMDGHWAHGVLKLAANRKLHARAGAERAVAASTAPCYCPNDLVVRTWGREHLPMCRYMAQKNRSNA